jgi:hypothetical protein
MNRLIPSLTAFILLTVSCKKDKDKAPTVGEIAGDYTLYEMETYNPLKTYEIPSPEGEYGKVVIKVTNDSTGTARLLMYNKSNKTIADTTFNCKIQKDQDGDFIMTKKINGKKAVYFYDNEIDFYALEGARFGARK